jgi:uncharacterized alpha-E superfamily protein
VSGQYAEFAANFGAGAAGNGDVVQRYMTWAPENPVSIRNSIRSAREGVRSIREVLGHEIWQATNELFLWFVGEEAASKYQQDRDEVYRNVRVLITQDETAAAPATPEVSTTAAVGDVSGSAAEAKL